MRHATVPPLNGSRSSFAAAATFAPPEKPEKIPCANKVATLETASVACRTRELAWRDCLYECRTGAVSLRVCACKLEGVGFVRAALPVRTWVCA
eukprot:2391491-Pleurochrysis_carterae.AAC.3